MFVCYFQAQREEWNPVGAGLEDREELQIQLQSALDANVHLESQLVAVEKEKNELELYKVQVGSTTLAAKTNNQDIHKVQECCVFM